MKFKKEISVSVAIGLLVLGLVMWGLPTYKVWSNGMRGRAALNEAEYDRQIAVAEANAKRESASLLGEAEVVRAKKKAEAISALGAALEQNPQYLKLTWIDEVAAGQAEGDTTVIYLPGDDLLPFASRLETGRSTAQNSAN